MTTLGKVKEINGNTATIEVFKESACTGKCEDCAGCKVSSVTAKAENKAKAKSGDIVEVYASTKKVMGLAVTVYLIPVIILIFSAVIFSFSGNSLLKGILILILISLYICFIIYENRKYKNNTQNTVIRIVKSSEEINGK